MACFENRFFLKRYPRAELLTIGTELVRGSVVNTNAAYLGQELTKLGFEVRGQVACPDDPSAIKSALRSALACSDVIFVSGGLGPTPDDITRETLADYFGAPLVFSQKQYRLIRRYYQKRNQPVPSIVRREACLPARAKPILNQFGVALGFLIETEGKIVIVVPGVPGELIRLFKHWVKPYLQRRFPGLRPASVLVVKTVGLSEPSIMQRLGRSFFKLGNFQFGIYPEVGEVGLRIYADSSNLTARLKRYVTRVLGPQVYSFSDEAIETVIGKRLLTKHCSISVAESCTGGEVSAAMIRIPGASAYFLGSVVAYSNETKSRLLGVPPALLRQKGAVSSQAAVAMARGVRQQFHSTLGLSITGIAGPRGGSLNKPVGSVCIAMASSKHSKVWEERFLGDRNQIQVRATKKALEYLWRWIR